MPELAVKFVWDGAPQQRYPGPDTLESRSLSLA
jgi:hypothetical protein